MRSHCGSGDQVFLTVVQLIPKVLDVVRVSVLCRQVKIKHHTRMRKDGDKHKLSAKFEDIMCEKCLCAVASSTHLIRPEHPRINQQTDREHTEGNVLRCLRTSDCVTFRLCFCGAIQWQE